MGHRERAWRIHAIVATAAAAAVMVGAATAGAQTLTIVAPAAPGGGWDQTARAMQRALRDVEPRAAIQVENVPGAAGTIGLARFVSAERGRPDALLVTGLVMVSGIATNGSAVSLADVTPIARLTGEHEVIAVPSDSPYRTLPELIDALKRAPQSVSWGGGSSGGTDDLLARLLAEAVGVPPSAVNYVAFAGGGEALAAVLGGQVTAGVSGYGEFSQSIAAGQIRALATSAPTRDAGIDIPTLRELGVPLDLANWRAVVAPPGISAAEQGALTARVRALVASAGWRDTLQRTGWSDLYLDGPAFRQFLLAEQARVVGVLERLQTGRGDAPAGFVPSPRTAPAAAILFALGMAGLLAWQRYRRAPAPDSTPGGHGRVAMVAAACLAHAGLMSVVGFVPTAALVFATGAHALGSPRPGRNLGIGMVLAAALAVLFGAGLDVALPMGAWAR
ncbi:MAG: tripartite tricarboxylate transporter substrate-binding protein [Acidobacteriota bacterium]|nr:tripartite tricarboxylate transporter substrate-binding protein [Acidobacteriota bacterium]